MAEEIWIDSDPVTREEEIQLEKRIADGDDDARNRLAMSCYPMLIRYCKQCKLVGHSMEEAVQEGCIGLMRAADKYDSSEYRFNTYAMWWIRQSVGLFLSKRHIVSIPLYIQTSIGSGSELPESQEGYKEKAMAIMEGVVSLDVDYDRVTGPMDYQSALDADEEREAVRCFVATLSDIQKITINMRSQGATLKQISGRTKVTREGVRQRLLRIASLYIKHQKKLSNED